MVLALIIDGPLTPEFEARALLAHMDQWRSLAHDGTIGATLRFEGVVRRADRDPEAADMERDLLALDYQTYDPMAQHGLEALAVSVAERHGLKSIVALHSRGRMGVGEVSFVLEVAAPRRDPRRSRRLHRPAEAGYPDLEVGGVGGVRRRYGVGTIGAWAEGGRAGASVSAKVMECISS